MSAAQPFVGRKGELDRLQHHLDAVQSDGQGRLLSVRGRRQAGKSRLLTEFADRSGLPQLFFTGSRLAPLANELAAFAVAATWSSLPGHQLFESVTLDGWAAAFRLLASALPDDGPAIVVLDEFPWLVESDPSIEGTLQTAWDRLFESKPVLFVLVGSDLAMMEALTTYERPLFGRPKELVVQPFSLGDTARMIGADDAGVAIDAQLVTGGYPRLCLEWRGAPSVADFFKRQFADESSDLVVVGRNILAAEFPRELQARQLLSAIGAGERSNKAIRARAGIPSASLHRVLELLNETKRVVAVDLPVSTRPSNDPRYRVADSYLRFWLRFVEPLLPDIARGRADLALSRVGDSWPDYRGRAVEPLVRESLERLAADDPVLAESSTIGGYWTRTGDVEVDVVGVDQWPKARRVPVVGSIKWREQGPFTRRDLAALAAHRDHVPGAEEAALVAVTRSGSTAQDLDAVYTPDDLLAAWR